jgi:5,10-methylenetetrahydrofolate reductase
VRQQKGLFPRREPASDEQEAEGIKIAIELIKQVLDIPGVRGVHVMAIEWESALEPIVKAAGLYPRPTFAVA